MRQNFKHHSFVRRKIALTKSIWEMHEFYFLFVVFRQNNALRSEKSALNITFYQTSACRSMKCARWVGGCLSVRIYRRDTSIIRLMRTPYIMHQIKFAVAREILITMHRIHCYMKTREIRQHTYVKKNIKTKLMYCK